MSLLTRQELSSVLKVSERKIERMDKSGEIPSIRVGKQYRYNLDDVLASLKENDEKR